MRRQLRAAHAVWALTVIFCMAAMAFPGQGRAQEAVGVQVGDTFLQLQGQTSPGAYVSITSDQGIIGTAVADTSGRFAQSLPAQTPGINNLSITARDTSGLATDTVKTQISLQPGQTTDLSIFLPPTLNVSPVIATFGQDVIASGNTFPNSTVILTLDNNLGQIYSDSSGHWLYHLSPGQLGAGQHQIVASVVDAQGSQSYPTEPSAFVIVGSQSQPVSPASPSPPSLPLSITVPTISYPAAGSTIHDRTITVLGKGPAHTQIELWNNDLVLGSVWSDYLGNWKLPLSLTPGTYELRARACADNRCSRFSATVNFTYTSPALPQQQLQAYLQHYTFSTAQSKTVYIPLQVRYGAAPYTVTITWGDGSSTTMDLTSNRTLLTHTYAAAGRYTCHIAIADASSRQDLYCSISVATKLPNGAVMHTSGPRYWTGITLVMVIALRFLLPFMLRHLRTKKDGSHKRRRHKE